jgi:hypothetical protein
MWSNACASGCSCAFVGCVGRGGCPNAAGFGLVGPAFGCCASGAGGRLRPGVVAGRARRSGAGGYAKLKNYVARRPLKSLFTLTLVAKPPNKSAPASRTQRQRSESPQRWRYSVRWRFSVAAAAARRIYTVTPRRRKTLYGAPKARTAQRPPFTSAPRTPVPRAPPLRAARAPPKMFESHR